MRTYLLRTALFALYLSTFATWLTAQTFKVPSVSFTGAPAFSQADLLKVSGLQPGATATQADLQSAAQRLSDTGLFADIRFQSNAAGLVYDLKPMPAENLLPATFTNFVWWTPAALTAELTSRVPLYTGVVPTSGNLQDSISAALKAMVAEKGVTANIAAIGHSSQPGAAPSSVGFAIESPEVRVHTLTLVHASPKMQAKLDKVIKDETGQPFEKDVTNAAITSTLTTAYHNQGYLDMAVLTVVAATPQVTSAGIDVDMTATVSEGQPYQLFQLTWPGSDIISTADFNKQVKMKPGDMASEAALRQSLSLIAGAYFAKGFQDARVKAPATFDRIGHHVSYTITVDPGPQYHIRSVRALGLSDEQQKQFNAAWQMKPGDFYDVTYLTSFLNKNSALTTLNGYSATYKAVSDPESHLVDLILTFAKGGVLN